MNTTAKSGRPVTVWFRSTQLARLDKSARTLGLSRSAFVRTTLEARIRTVLDETKLGPLQLERVAGDVAQRAIKALEANGG